MARKLWRAARILNRSPFDQDILDHTVAQLDFILAMEAEDHPDQWKFERGGPIATAMEVHAAWEAALTGKSRTTMLAPMMPSPAVLERARELAAAAEMLKKAAGR